MTREEHLAQCKTWALEYLDDGDIGSAVVSMIDNLNTHPENCCNPMLAVLGMMRASKGDHIGVREWITGFR